jgi:hypothetical protein
MAQHSVAREWDDAMLDAIRRELPRPTVHARNLYQVSAAMYDAWAAYDATAQGVLTSERATAADVAAARREAISFAAYRVLTNRYTAASNTSPAANAAGFNTLMANLGYNTSFTSTVGDSPAAVGNRIAAQIIAHGMNDGSNQANNYRDTTGYASVNPDLDPLVRGTVMVDPNRWQELDLSAAISQNGIPTTSVPPFVTPHWNQVTPFAMVKPPGSGSDDLYYNPPPPPKLGGVGDQAFKDAAVKVIRLSSQLDPNDPTTIDLSPGAMGNNPLGTNDGTGHAINPKTGQPYAPNVVKRSDFGRVLAEFWADGPASETPPGHWNTIANAVFDHPDLVRRIGGAGPVVDPLEWDVKLYVTLNGAVHDAGITAWGLKREHDYARPISMVRYMGGKGQSSDASKPGYHAQGLPLVNDLIEVLTEENMGLNGEPDAKFQQFANPANVGKIVIKAWKGGGKIDPEPVYGTEWMFAEQWWPYQRPTFVTPSFPGFISGHSTFSRAAAEVMAAFTGDAYFPGGLGVFDAEVDEYLKFEAGPSTDIQLQWATYFDAADQSGQSRIWGGIHVDADDFVGRQLGSLIGIDSWELAQRYFTGMVPEPSGVGVALVAGVTLLARRRRR